MAEIAVWDVREPGWSHGREAKEQWLKEQGLLGLFIYRVEFLLMDAPCARIFCYARNGQGKRHWLPCHVPGPHDHSACDVAREAPRIVPLSTLPPRELLDG